jgi:anti-sigma regulatory factor (Ser/Thr protein kinase)
MNERTAEQVFASGPQAPGRARRFLHETLAAWGSPDLAAEAELALSEVVTNAFLHGRGDISLRLTMTGVLRVAVHDSGPGRPALRQYSTTATTGRGLHLVGSLTDRWGTIAGDGGKWVWFELDLDRRQSEGSGPAYQQDAAHDAPDTQAEPALKDDRVGGAGGTRAAA